MARYNEPPTAAEMERDTPMPSERVEIILGLLEDNAIPTEVNDKIVELVEQLEAENSQLRHEVDSTRGLWCIDRNPNEVDIDWVRANAFQLGPVEKGGA